MNKIFLLISLFLAACSGDNPPTLIGTWVYDGQNYDGLGYTFRNDNTYTSDFLILTSSTSANAMVETGIYDVSGGIITFTPKEFSCSGPDPISECSYSFQGHNLILSFSNVVYSMSLDTTSGGQIALSIGCFDSNDNFTFEPLAPVSN